VSLLDKETDACYIFMQMDMSHDKYCPAFQEAIAAAGYTEKVKICMDSAASEFWNEDLKKYDLDFKSPKGDESDTNRYVSLFGSWQFQG